jgi:hypothetical protein
VVNRIATALDVTPSMIADEVISAEVVIAEVLGAAEAVSTASVR